MILGLTTLSFLALFGAPAVVIALMAWYCWRIARGDD